jgi:hypothetical protein
MQPALSGVQCHGSVPFQSGGSKRLPRGEYRRQKQEPEMPSCYDVDASSKKEKRGIRTAPFLRVAVG